MVGIKEMTKYDNHKQTISEQAGWPMDRCAECGNPENNGTDAHPPLCPKCAALWYGPPVFFGQYNEDEK